MRRAVAWLRENPNLALVPRPLSAAKTGSGSGASSIGQLRSAGVGAETFTGTGASHIGGLRSAGAAVEAFIGTGVARLGRLRSAGVGAETFTGTGAARLGRLRSAGNSGLTGTGSIHLGRLRSFAMGKYNPDRRHEGASFWQTRGIKPGTEVKDRLGRVGIAMSNANGAFVIVKTSNSTKLVPLSDWKKA